MTRPYEEVELGLNCMFTRIALENHACMERGCVITHHDGSSESPVRVGDSLEMKWMYSHTLKGRPRTVGHNHCRRDQYTLCDVQSPMVQMYRTVHNGVHELGT